MGIHMQTLFVLYKNAAARAAAGLTYLLNAGFDGPDLGPPLPASLGAPYVIKGGPLTVVQNDGQFSIVGGALVFPAQATPVWGDQGFYGAAFARVAGRALLSHVHLTTRNAVSPQQWSTVNDLSGAGINTNAEAGLYLPVNGQVWMLPGLTIIAGDNTILADTDYAFCVVLQSTGHLIFLHDTDWRLLWVGFNGNTAMLYPRARNYTGAGNMDYIRIRDLPDPFNVDDGLCVVDVAAPVSGTAYTSVADAISDLTVTAPAVLDGDANTRCGLYYRADADLTPAWHLYVDGQGRGRLDSIAADGTRTNRINVAAVIAGGATVTLRSIYDATLHNCYSLAGVTWTKRGGEINVSLNDTVTRIIPEAPAGWTLGALRSWPRTSAVYDELDRT